MTITALHYHLPLPSINNKVSTATAMMTFYKLTCEIFLIERLDSLSASLLRGHLCATHITAVGESGHFILAASFNVPSGLHASPSGLLGSLSTVASA